jgi:uncharacterized delta-60 repeat protein
MVIDRPERKERPVIRGLAGGRRARLVLVPIVMLLVVSEGFVARAAGGDLDPTFNGDGRATTWFASGGQAHAVALQPDGKLVVAGLAAGADRFGLARYLSDGSLDPSFGNGGKVTTNFTKHLDWANDVTVLPNGKIVAVGHANFKRIAIARYRPDGSLDPSFGKGGKVLTRVWRSATANAVAVQADGKIVVAGQASERIRSAFVLVRYRWNGTRDRSFGGAGIVTTAFQALTGNAYDLAIQPNGRIVAVGEGVIANGFCVARYRRDGRLDRSFGHGGKVRTPIQQGIGGGAAAVALQPDGRVVVAGIGGDIFGPFAVARYLTDGSLDPRFSGNGRAVANVAGGEESATDVVVQHDGRIVLVGYADVPHEFGDPGMGGFALVRFRRNGSLDPSFGGGDGKLLTPFPGGVSLGQGAVLQTDGRIVAAGWVNGRFAVARYLA